MSTTPTDEARAAGIDCIEADDGALINLHDRAEQGWMFKFADGLQVMVPCRLPTPLSEIVGMVNDVADKARANRTHSAGVGES